MKIVFKMLHVFARIVTNKMMISGEYCPALGTENLYKQELERVNIISHVTSEEPRLNHPKATINEKQHAQVATS